MTLNKPVFLLGAHKSGTSLLRSIFDGHPDLFVIPFETHYFQNMHYWVDCNYRMERPETLTEEELKRRFVSRLKAMNEADDRIGDVPIEFKIDVEEFRVAFQDAITNMDDQKRFELYINALHRSLYSKDLPAGKRVVEKSVEHAEFAQFLKKMFPDAKFIYIIRNPYANAVSLRKYKTIRSRFPLMVRLLSTLYNSYYYLYRNRQLIKDFLVIRYEDLLTDPSKKISEMADFLEIRNSDRLFKLTKFGRNWKGNSSEGRVLEDFDTSRIDAWQTSISPMEIRFLNTLFHFVFKDFGYEMLPTPSLLSFMKPLKGELVFRYIINRAYLGYISYDPGHEI